MTACDYCGRDVPDQDLVDVARNTPAPWPGAPDSWRACEKCAGIFEQSPVLPTSPHEFDQLVGILAKMFQYDFERRRAERDQGENRTGDE